MSVFKADPAKSRSAVVSRPFEGVMLQRKCACGQHTIAGGECDSCREEELEKLQRSPFSPSAPAYAPPIVHEVLNSPGQPLDRETRALMEPRFGHDFSQVRVHTGSKAAESARAVNAKAYTIGQAVVLGSGWDPTAASGRALLAHELTHVVQQSGRERETSQGLRVGPADGLLEAEASRAEESVAQGGEASAGVLTHHQESFAQRSTERGRDPVDGFDPSSPSESVEERPEGIPQAVQSSIVGRMESAFGISFGGVRLRTGPEPDRVARGIGALAYTDGREIGFASGQFAPQTSEGMRTIAHEFAHVAQQRGGTPGRGPGALSLDAEPATGRVLARSEDPDDKDDEAEAEAEDAAERILRGEEPAISMIPLDIAGQSPGRAKATVPGSYRVSREKSGYAFTFNSSDVLAWDDPKIKIFKYYVYEVFGASEAIASEYLESASGTPSKKNRDRLFLTFDAKGRARTGRTVSVVIKNNLNDDVVAWMKIHHPELAAVPPAEGYKDLSPDDAASGGGGDGKKKEKGKRKGAKEGGEGPESQVVRDDRRLYSFLFRTFPTHVVFSQDLALLEDLLQFIANEPDHRAKLPATPARDEPPKKVAPWTSFLDAWHNFLYRRRTQTPGQKPAEGHPGGTAEGKKGGAPGGEKGGEKAGVVQFEPAARLVMRSKESGFVKGSKLAFRVEFDREPLGNYMINFFPHHADYDWSIWLGEKKVDSGPFFGGTGTIEYEPTLKWLGSLTVRVVISSVYFKGGKTLTLEQAGLIVLEERARSKEVFNDLLANPKDPRAAFERDEKGKLRLKREEPLTARGEQLQISYALGGIEGLLKARKITEDQAKTYRETLEARKRGLDKIIAIEEATEKEIDPATKSVKTRKKFPAYLMRGVFLSRETSEHTEEKAFLYNVKREKAPPTLNYKVEAWDATLDPASPDYHPGEGHAPAESARPESEGWALAERQAIVAMLDHWHTYNEYPDGTIRLGLKLKEGNEATVERSFDTHSGRKTLKTALGVVAAVGGVVLLAASPFTGGTTAPVGLVLLQATVVAAGTASILLEIEDMYQQKGELKFNRRLALNLVQLVATLGGGAGFTGAFRSAGAVGRGLYLGTLAGLDIGGFILISIDVREKIRFIEADYAVRIAKNGRGNLGNHVLRYFPG